MYAEGEIHAYATLIIAVRSDIALESAPRCHCRYATPIFSLPLITLLTLLPPAYAAMLRHTLIER